MDKRKTGGMIRILVILIIGFFSFESYLFAQYTIRGTIKNAAHQTLYLENMFAQQFTLVDTIKLDSLGGFTMEGQLSEDAILRLRIGKVHSWWLILEKGMYDVEVNLNRFRKDKYNIKGSASSTTLYNYFKKQRAFLQKMQMAKRKLYEIKAKQEAAQANQELLSSESRNIALEEIQNHKDKVFSLSEEYFNFLKSYIDTSKSLTAVIAAESLPAEQFPTYLRKAIKQMKKEFNNSKYVIHLEKTIEHKLKLIIGAEAPEIELKSPEDKIIKLSSLRGKYVLIDFWASWCRPCRAANPHIVKLYKKYKKKGFAVYSVSLDQRLPSWKKAIEMDELSWDWHVSDLKGWRSAAAKEYEIRGIPSTFLLDKKGRIIAKDLRGDALDRKLREIFE